MKKLPIFTFILIILVTLSSFYLNFLGTYQKEKRTWILIGEYGPFYFYNGTRYSYKDFSVNFMTEEKDKFELSFSVSFNGYSDKIYVNYPKSELLLPFDPITTINNSGYYRLNSIIITPNVIYGEYPYDILYSNISLWATNDTYGKPLLNYLIYNYSSENWNVNVDGEWNELYFTFIRTTEKASFEFFKNLCIGFFIFSIAPIILLWIFYNKYKDKKMYERYFKFVKYILTGDFFISIISITVEYIIFQGYNYFSSPYVQYLTFILFTVMVFVIVFGLYIKKYAPEISK